MLFADFLIPKDSCLATLLNTCLLQYHHVCMRDPTQPSYSNNPSAIMHSDGASLSP